jgi:hypothetical protein
LTEHKIDPYRYRGMDVEEARRAMAEDERRAINEDPRTIASIRAVERHAAEKAAEQQRNADEAERQRQAEAAAEMEDERARLLRSWRQNGGTPAEFEIEWPAMKRRLIARRVEELDAERERVAFRA